MGQRLQGDKRLMNRRSITLRVNQEAPLKLEELARRLHLLSQRSQKVGQPSLSRLLDFLAEHADKVYKAFDPEGE